MGYGNICVTGLNEMLYRKGTFLKDQLVKNPSGNAGDPSLIPGSGRSPREGIGYLLQYSWASPCGSAGKESTCNVGDLGLISRLGRSPGEGEWLPTPVFWPGDFHGLYNPRESRRVGHD